MRFHSTGWLAGGFAVALTCACAGPAGTGAVLSPKSGMDATEPTPDRTQLATGQVVVTPLDFDRGSSHYVGGVSSGLVPASPERVLAAMEDVGALGAMLPKTKRVTLVDSHGSDRRLELLQGNSFVNATYTVDLSSSEAPGEVRFQMDRSRRHDINDVYGYFKVERFDDRNSVVTVAAAVDIGSGVTAMLVSKRVQDIILSTPHVMHDYFERAEASDRRALVAQNDR